MSAIVLSFCDSDMNPALRVSGKGARQNYVALIFLNTAVSR